MKKKERDKQKVKKKEEMKRDNIGKVDTEKNKISIKKKSKETMERLKIKIK